MPLPRRPGRSNTRYEQSTCRCCGGPAWYIATVKHPMGIYGARLRCDGCRRACAKSGPCRLPAVEPVSGRVA